MQQLHAQHVASITELKKNPTKLINDAKGQAVAILNHNVAAAYLVPSETFEKLLDMIDDTILTDIVRQRTTDSANPIKVKFDDL